MNNSESAGQMASEKLTPEEWVEHRKLRNAKRKRERAIKVLRDTGMTDAEIERELGHSLTETSELSFSKSNGRTEVNGSRGVNGRSDSERAVANEVDGAAIPASARVGQSVNGDEIVDAEIVENLPAVIDFVPSERTGGHEDESPMKVAAAATQSEDKQRQGSSPPRMAPESWWESKLEEHSEKRCAAHNSRGEQCRKFAIAGAKVCHTHGGAARHVKAAARARLENAADRMARNLLGLAEFADSENVKLSATNSALDRAGITTPTQVEIGPTKPYEEIFEDISTGSRAESRRARGIQINSGSPSEAGSFTGIDESGSIARDFDSDSNSRVDSPPPAPATAVTDPSATSERPLRDTERRERPRPDREHRPSHIVGDGAVQAANAINRALGAMPPPKGLPPGRRR